MKALVATTRTQGQRPGDFSFTVPGELVYLANPCARDQEDPDGGCGCGRSFVGLNTARGTTTAEVRELDYSADDYLTAIRSGLEAAGWEPAHARHTADQMLSHAAGHPVGAVVQRRLTVVSQRQAES